MTEWNTHEMIVVPGDSSNVRNGEAAIVQLRDGSLLLGWSEFYGGQGADWSPCRLAGKVSKDGGLTWSDKFILLANEGRQSTMEVDFLRLSSGGMCLFYCRKNDNDDCRVMMRKSKDEGHTWSQPKQLSDWHGYVGLTNDRSILTSTGRIVLPFWYDIQDAFVEPWYMVCQAMYSDDEGETWHNSMPPLSVPGSPSGGDEPAVVELFDGRLLMMMRGESGRIWQSISEDGGSRWERPTPTNLGASTSPFSLKRIPGSRDIMVIWNQASKKEIEWGFIRNRLSCAISRDDCCTWSHFKNLESLDDITRVEPTPVGETSVMREPIWCAPIRPEGSLNCSYPSCTFVGENAVITYFYNTDHTSLKLRVIPIGWFYDDDAPSYRTVGGTVNRCDTRWQPTPV